MKTCVKLLPKNIHVDQFIWPYVSRKTMLSFLTEFMKEALSNYCETIENLTPNKLVYDNHGRAHLHTPSAGRSYVFLRAQRFNGTTISTHITDLYDILT